MFEFFEIHRAFYFLIKFRSKLKQKIFDTNNVSKIRENILNVAIMQKKNLKRTRENDDDNNSNSNFNQNRFQFKSKNLKNFNKFSQQQQQFRQNDLFSRKRQQSRTINKRSFDIANADIDLSKIECYHCHKMKHYKTDCSELRQIAKIVNDEMFETKNDKTS